MSKHSTNLKSKKLIISTNLHINFLTFHCIVTFNTLVNSRRRLLKIILIYSVFLTIKSRNLRMGTRTLKSAKFEIGYFFLSLTNGNNVYQHYAVSIKRDLHDVFSWIMKSFSLSEERCKRKLPWNDDIFFVLALNMLSHICSLLHVTYLQNVLIYNRYL